MVSCELTVKLDSFNITVSM